ncbi:biotin/lipoyl-binding protein [Paenibacillus sp. P25]|nr:biotin/lipoyl-binding protein [Paenibacillus sp. P25]
MRKHNKLWVPAILTLAAVSALPGCSTPNAQGAVADGLTVKTIKLGQTADAGLSGKIIPDQEVKVVSKVSGKVSSINVEEGSKVKKGDVFAAAGDRRFNAECEAGRSRRRSGAGQAGRCGSGRPQSGDSGSGERRTAGSGDP